ncbi:MAG: hypothetical protein J6S58_05900 [Lentisphaeria bacterium]|nr:hypothetical protein [Lentisphaeria bacterium]
MSKKKDKIQQDDPKQYLAAQKGAGNAKDENLVEEISENFDRFEAWVIENGKYILSVCVILVIGVAVFFTVTHFQAQARKQATLRLANAEKIADLEKILKEVSSSTPGYDVAQIRLARAFAAEKKYDQAFAAYQAVAARKNDLFLANRSNLDSAYIREIAGKAKEATVIFAMVADDVNALPDHRTEGAYAAGRLFLEAKNIPAAKKYLGMFDPLKLNTPVAAQWAAIARSMLYRIPSDKAPSKKAVAPAKKAVAPAKKAPAKKAVAPAKKAPAKKVPAKK